jgi:phosphoglycerol transferase
MRAGGIRRLLVGHDLGLGVLTAALTSVLTVLALQLWKADLSVPLTYRGDALPTGAHFKTVRETGWYEYQPLLGAPAGQTYHDFPTADNLHMIAARILGFVTPDWATAMNVYFLLGFPLAALTALWFLRRCGISPWLASALASLYAIAPYHFLRGESHLFLASYYVVPLAAVLLVDVVRGERLWGWSSTRSGVARFVFSPSVRTALILALLATASSYYSVFFLALLAPAAIFVLVRDGVWRRFWGATVAGVVTVAVMVLNMLPDLVFSWVNGPNPAGLDRSGGEAEFYALKFAQLVLPWPGHRIGVLAQTRQLYDEAYVSLGEQPALGLIGAVGFVAAFIIVLGVAFTRVRDRAAATSDPRTQLLAGLSALILGAFMYATLGGISTLISVLTSSLRGWNRMSILIAILSLAIVGILLDLALSRVRRLSAPRARSVAAGVVALVLVGLGFLDQTPGDSDREYASNVVAFARDEAYFGDLEDRLPDQAMVLVLPSVPFPESNADSGLLASDQLVPYLHSETIRWSTGGIKGRPVGDWPSTLESYGVEHVATLAATAEFSGILVDRPAATDGGAALETALAAVVGVAPIVSENGRYAFYDLRDFADGLDLDGTEEVSADITDPVIAYPAPDFRRLGETTTLDPLEARSTAARFTVVNDADETRKAVVSVEIEATPGSVVTVTLPDGSTVRRQATAARVPLTLDIDAAPGTSTVFVSVVNPDGTAAERVYMTPPVTRQSALIDYLAATDG